MFGDLSTVSIVEEVSPLVYPRWANVLRLSAYDSAAPPPLPFDEYFAPTERHILRSKTGRVYKKPRIERIPGAPPGVVSFLDYHLIRWADTPDYIVYLDYLKTRQDQRDRGLMHFLIDALFERYPDASMFDFGRIMSPTAWKIFQQKQAAGIKVHGYKYF